MLDTFLRVFVVLAVDGGGRKVQVFEIRPEVGDLFDCRRLQDLVLGVTN